jgi:hypothetical protein
MQEAEQKMVDIDTSGPGQEVAIKEEEKQEEVVEQQTTEPEVKEEQKEEQKEEHLEGKAGGTQPDAPAEEPKKEDKKDSELEDYSQGVQRRIAKLTKKWREAERQKDEALKYAESVIAEQKTLKTKVSKLEPGFLTATEQSINSGLEAAKAKLATAREAGDLQSEIDAQTAISELGYRKAKFLEAKDAQERMAKQQVTKKPSLQEAIKPRESKPDPRAEAWAEKNPWFGTDSAMTYTAMDYHRKLTEEEGFDTASDEYYAEIDKRMRLDFPHKYANNSDTAETQTTKPVQQVASATRSTKSGRKTVRLTSSQVAIAKKLGVPLEEYAKQLKITKEV